MHAVMTAPPPLPAHESCQAASQLMTLPVQPAVRGGVRVHTVLTAPPPYLHMSPARQPASSWPSRSSPQCEELCACMLS